jgi:hypothetical protein
MLFSAEMVRALLKDKTQTRRPMKPQPDEDGLSKIIDGPWVDTSEKIYHCPYGNVGDHIWVRETWGVGSRPDPWGGYDGIEYRADESNLDEHDDLPCYKVETPDGVCLGDYRSGWHPSIHMPRWASRITLEITDVRVQRLQGISEEDAQAEGLTANYQDGIECSAIPQERHRWHKPHRAFFSALWESTYGPGSWDRNDWVWALTFKVVKP